MKSLLATIDEDDKDKLEEITSLLQEYIGQEVYEISYMKLLQDNISELDFIRKSDKQSFEEIRKKIYIALSECTKVIGEYEKMRLKIYSNSDEFNNADIKFLLHRLI